MGKPFSMTEECTDKYRVNERGEEGVEIFIKVPKRFKNLWLAKLTDLTTTVKEIEEWEEE